MNIREHIVTHVIDALKEIDDPRPVLVTREPFEVTELAITQFPALLVSFATETRQLLTMGSQGKKNGIITFNIRGFVRGKELDRQRNELINAVEIALESERYRELYTNGVRDSQIVAIEVIERIAPLAEILVTVEVQYVYTRLNP
jgi:methyl coenzyme M reductase subunit C